MIFKTARRHSSPEFRHVTRRASVLILVVAVLALLVLMGTAYLVSARTDRANASAMSNANNVELARDAVMNTVVTQISDPALDGNGNVGAYGVNGTPPITYSSRFYDYPEGIPASATYNAAYNKFVTNYNPFVQAEPWLAAKLHTSSSTSMDVSQLTQYPFNPLNGTYDSSIPWTNSWNVVNDQTATADSTTEDANILVGGIPTNDAYVNLLPFSDASGVRYRFGVRIIDTNRMANLNAGSPDAIGDVYGQFLTGFPLAVDSTTPSPNNLYKAADNPATNLHVSVGGRVGSGGAAFTFASWQTQLFNQEQTSGMVAGTALFDLSDELELRSYGEFGTSYLTRIANANPAVWPATLGNLNGSGVVIGNPSRRNYTTDSFSRELNPFPYATAPGLRYTIGGADTSSPPWVQPFSSDTGKNPAIPRAAANIAIAAAINGGSTAQVVIPQIATNLATALRLTSNTYDNAGTPVPIANSPFAAFSDNTKIFTQDQIAQFAANFIQYRWDDFEPDPLVSSTTAYALLNGPSFVYDQGICARGTGVSGDTSGGSDVKAPAGKMCVGYAAQPFINEVAAELSTPDSTTTVVGDMAIELYNPYPFAMSLTKFHLKCITPPGSSTADIDLSGNYIPANGYFVIDGMGHFTSALAASGTLQLSTNSTLVSSAGTTWVLYRPYTLPSAAVNSLGGLAAIDRTDSQAVALFNYPAASLSPTVTKYSVSRSSAPWGWSVNVFTAPSSTTISIGIGNKAGGNAGYTLWDRYSNPYIPFGTPAASPNVNAGDPFVNIGEFNRIMRIGNEVSYPSGDYLTPTSMLLSDQINGIISTPTPPAPYQNMYMPIEAQLHFDFMAEPGIYGNANSPSTSGVPTDYPTPPIKQGDIRAVRLLDQITFLDRVFDQTVAISSSGLLPNYNDINKLRLPGKININTASGDVLRALPPVVKIGGINADKLVAYILAYRARLLNTDPLATYHGQQASDSFNNATNYPGHGFRSLPELLVPICLYEQNVAADLGTTLDSRDQLWATFYNLCTVRSDTFAVYGYLEAVRSHPKYTTALTAADWYGDETTVSDDPNNGGGTVRLLRMSRRRWVALVDRSFANYSRYDATSAANSRFVPARLVAIKDLPQ